MELGDLQHHILTLASLEASFEPIVNCYLNLETGYRKTLNDQVCALKNKIEQYLRPSFWEAMGRIEVYIGTNIRPESRGVAVFSRGGKHPFFLPLQFGAPLPNSVTVSATPHIYNLAELNDNCYRYVVVCSTEESARILEVNVGTVTEAIRKERPELRRRVGREWTKEHYQSHCRARAQQFVNEQIEFLDQVMSTGGYKHFFLAGDPRITSRIQKALPKHLYTRLVSTVRASGNDKTTDIVAATLSSFHEYEEKESLAILGRLDIELRNHGPAVAGTQASIKALKDGQAKMLVLSKTYDPASGWSCNSCKGLLAECQRPQTCPACGNDDFQELCIKEEMVRLAVLNGCPVEIVEHGDCMNALGGVGCLLRFMTPEQFNQPAA